MRIIKDKDLLLVEYALPTAADETSAAQWAYQTARHYPERYAPGHGTGLIPSSLPLVQDIIDFWMRELGLDMETVLVLATMAKPKEKKVMARSSKQKLRFTHRQGQFLAFIHLYRKLHRQGSAELDMVQYFGVTPPSVHGMSAWNAVGPDPSATAAWASMGK